MERKENEKAEAAKISNAADGQPAKDPQELDDTQLEGITGGSINFSFRVTKADIFSGQGGGSGRTFSGDGGGAGKVADIYPGGGGGSGKI